MLRASNIRTGVLIFALVSLQLVIAGSKPGLAQGATSNEAQGAWFVSVGGQYEKWLMPKHTVGIYLTEASGFKANTFNGDLNVGSTLGEIGFRLPYAPMGNSLRVSIFGYRASGNGSDTHETSLAPGLGGIFVLPRLDGTIGGGVWTFGAGEEISDRVRFSADKWLLGLRAAAEFVQGADQKWIIGASLSGGQSRFDTNVTSNYVDISQPDFQNRLFTSIRSRVLETRLEGGVEQRVVGPVFVFANASAGISVKESHLDASQFIFNTVQASTSHLAFADVRTGLMLSKNPLSGAANVDS